MFISLMRKNSKKSHRENSIYFVSLIISIVAFYVILSLEKQDVMIFLKQMESDAVDRLFRLISGAYGFSLFLIFFLIYFAEKYQLERRSHEFGVLLMLGMKRRRLFMCLMAEDFYSGTMALVIGLPVAVFLSEMISLITAKLIGLGIIGHRFTLSVEGLALTVIGFLGIKLAANILLSFKIIKREPYRLMHDTQEEKLKVVNEKRSFGMLVFGILFLAIAYAMAIVGVSWENLQYFAYTLVFGVLGTFLLIKGFCAIFSKLIKNRKGKEELHMFTFRQLQENVFLRSGALTISSLLVLVAIACMSYGISVSVTNLQNGNRHNMDFTFEQYDEESGKNIRNLMEQEKAKELIADWRGIRVTYLPTRNLWEEDTDRKICEYDTTPMKQAAGNLSQEQREILENMNIYRDNPHMIALSGINEILKNQGKEALSLEQGELFVYIDPELYGAEAKKTFDSYLQCHPKMLIDDEEYVIKAVCSFDIVVDRSITIGFGIILPDELFDRYADKDNIYTYWNVWLSKSLIEEKGLMQAVMEGNEYFSGSGLEYENYLQNMGRQVFYVVAASYLTIYLALIFLIIANTVISLLYLMQEKKTKRRYHTLIRLGSTYEKIWASAKRQIKWYFGVPLGAAFVSGIFGVYSLFSGILPSNVRGQGSMLILMAVIVMIILCVVECVYVKMVMHISRENIVQMMEIRRIE